MSIQLANKAVLRKKKKREREKKERKKVNVYLIKNSKGERGGALSQAVGRTGRSSMGV